MSFKLKNYGMEIIRQNWDHYENDDVGHCMKIAKNTVKNRRYGYRNYKYIEEKVKEIAKKIVKKKLK